MPIPQHWYQNNWKWVWALFSDPMVRVQFPATASFSLGPLDKALIYLCLSAYLLMSLYVSRGWIRIIAKSCIRNMETCIISTILCIRLALSCIRIIVSCAIYEKCWKHSLIGSRRAMISKMKYIKILNFILFAGDTNLFSYDTKQHQIELIKVEQGACQIKLS